MVHIKHRVGIKAPVEKVFEALATREGVAGWWTSETSGKSEVGGTIVVRFISPQGQEVGSMDIKIVALEQNKKVNWRFTAGPQEWIGTDVVFEIRQEEDFTIVMFSHLNWADEVEFKSHCSMKWAVFLLSLKQFVETGKGSPSPGDIKIDNWN